MDDVHIEEMKKLSHTYFAPKEGESVEIVYPYRAKTKPLSAQPTSTMWVAPMILLKRAENIAAACK